MRLRPVARADYAPRMRTEGAGTGAAVAQPARPRSRPATAVELYGPSSAAAVHGAAAAAPAIAGRRGLVRREITKNKAFPAVYAPPPQPVQGEYAPAHGPGGNADLRAHGNGASAGGHMYFQPRRQTH